MMKRKELNLIEVNLVNGGITEIFMIKGYKDCYTVYEYDRNTRESKMVHIFDNATASETYIADHYHSNYPIFVRGDKATENRKESKAENMQQARAHRCKFFGRMKEGLVQISEAVQCKAVSLS